MQNDIHGWSVVWGGLIWSFDRLRGACILLGIAFAYYQAPVWAQVQIEPPKVSIDCPAPFDALINKAIRPVLETARVDDEGDSLQLLRRLRPVIRDALATEGYFSPNIDRLSDDTLLKLKVELGPRAVVDSVQIEFEGEVLNPIFDERRVLLASGWRLERGQPFNQELWAASKDSVLRDLRARDFPQATLSASLADVDPELNVVHLSVTVDSGPQIKFGAVEVEGLVKYSADLVRSYAGFEPGARYEQEKLLQFQARLQATSYFSSVDVDLDLDQMSHADHLTPVRVRVVESDSKRIGLGAGYSSNTGFRTEVNYQFNNLWQKAWDLNAGLRLEQKRQSVYTDVFLPPDRFGVVDAYGAAVDHQQLEQLDIERQSVGTVRKFSVDAVDYQVGLNVQFENRQLGAVEFSSSKATVLSASAERSRVDDRLNPRSGYLRFSQIAVASNALLSDQDFIRLYGKVQAYWPVGRVQTLSLRAEAGTVLASLEQNIPQDYLFRAGGANSVRGFDYLGLSVLNQGIKVGGRRLIIGSAEYTDYFKENFGWAVFTDIGSVSNSWNQVEIKKSVGAGLRYKSPAGPIALDIAKGVGERRPRIHFALGVSF